MTLTRGSTRAVPQCTLYFKTRVLLAAFVALLQHMCSTGVSFDNDKACTPVVLTINESCFH